METEIFVARDFTKYPGPRYRTSGPFSGQQFREELIAPKLQEAIDSGNVLVVVLDDVAGYRSSFLDEAFAGLIRSGFTLHQLDAHLQIVARTRRFRRYAVRANEFIDEEATKERMTH